MSPLVIVFSTHGDTAHARQLATQPARLCFELNLSGTYPLMVNESKPRSTPTPPREGDEVWGCPLMFLKKCSGCDCTVCIAGRVAQACLGTAPSGTGVRTYDCGACENLLTVLDMISTCGRGQEGGRGVSASLARSAPSLEELASRTPFSFGPVRVWCVTRARHPSLEIPLCSFAVLRTWQPL